MQLRRVAVATLNVAFRPAGYQLARRDFYSPIPRVPRGGDPWANTRSLVGVELDLEAQLEFIDSALSPYLDEFAPPHDDASAGEFYLWNEYYQAGDADSLYAMLRHLKPRRLLELGSGFSTLVSAAACAENAREGSPCQLVAVDPSPRIPLRAGPHVQIDNRDAQALPLERYLELERGDVLFIDSSHTVKLGSEVNFLVLEVLPRLRPGVVVHFHDIFLPFEYPRAWFDRGTYLSEQYLLHAFLIDNPGYEVLLAVQALWREYPERMANAIPALAADRENYPSAFWLIRRDATAS
jgi:predicted O-methyltransferase YrrM